LGWREGLKQSEGHGCSKVVGTNLKGRKDGGKEGKKEGKRQQEKGLSVVVLVEVAFLSVKKLRERMKQVEPRQSRVPFLFPFSLVSIPFSRSRLLFFLPCHFV